MTTTTPDVVTAAWVAERLHRPLRTVVRQARDGKLPTVGKLPGRTGAYLFDREAIEEVAA